MSVIMSKCNAVRVPAAAASAPAARTRDIIDKLRRAAYRFCRVFRRHCGAKTDLSHFPRCAQPVVRFSMMAKSSYMAMAIAPITTSPAKASGIFIEEPADTSR